MKSTKSPWWPSHDLHRGPASDPAPVRRGFSPLVEDFTAATRAEPGCLSFEWSRSTADPGVYFLVEAFRDAAAGQAHVGSDHFKAAIARMPELLAGAPEIVHADLPVEGWSRMAELQPAGQ